MKDDREKIVGSAASATPEDVAGTPPPPPPEVREGSRKLAGPLGGAGGAVAGGTAGTVVAGPIGTIVGAIAGAVGGWWAASAAGRGEVLSEEDEREFRAGHDEWYNSAEPRPADRAYERVRPAYELGVLARENPDYRGRSFESIEDDLRHGWTSDVSGTHGEWESARHIARKAYMSARERAEAGNEHAADLGGTESHRRASYADPHPGLADVPTGEELPEQHPTKGPFPRGDSYPTDNTREDRNNE